MRLQSLLLLLHLGVSVAGGKGPQMGYRKTAIPAGWRQGGRDVLPLGQYSLYGLLWENS